MNVRTKHAENPAPKECVMGTAFASAQNSIHVLLIDVMERNVERKCNWIKTVKRNKYSNLFQYTQTRLNKIVGYEI